eukprot:1161738-Prorocentrum_minimum.AAC.1
MFVRPRIRVCLEGLGPCSSGALALTLDGLATGAFYGLGVRRRARGGGQLGHLQPTQAGAGGHAGGHHQRQPAGGGERRRDPSRRARPRLSASGGG